MFRIVIDHLPPTLNKYTNGKTNWYWKKAVKDEWLGLFQAAFIEAKLPKKLPEAISLNVTQFCKGVVRDADNSVIGAKFCGDSLVKLGYLKNDNQIKPIILNTVKGKTNKMVIILAMAK